MLGLGLAAAVVIGGWTPTQADALRKATPKERSQLLAAEARRGNDTGICRHVGFILRVSTVNTQYARASYHNTIRQRYGCSVGDGFSVYRKVVGTGRYRHIADYSWTGAPCSIVPRRIALDLVRDAARWDPDFRRCDRW